MHGSAEDGDIITEDTSRYYTLLRDPARRKIVEILGNQGKIGFKELKQELGLGVGTVYYHLDMLSDFLRVLYQSSRMAIVTIFSNEY